MRKLFLGMAVAAALLTTSARAETVNCTEITAVPFVITVQGVYCFKSDKGSSVPNGNAIEIQTNNVTIDLNGFKLGGLGAGAGTLAIGIFAQDRKNITIRNGTIRGFATGVFLDQIVAGTSSGHLLEDLLLDQNRFDGAKVEGSGHVIRNNRVVNTGASDVATIANGIQVQSASNTVITDNVVSGTSETGTVRGIFVLNSALIGVRGNTVLDTRDATTKRGIEINSSADVTVIDNRILNATGTGTNGVVDFGSTGINCIDNTVAGFATALFGCDFSAGNNTP